MLTEEYPVRVVCRTLDYAPSSYYYRGQGRDEGGLRTALLRLAGEWPTYGRPRLTAMLRREGWVVNPKRIGRLMREMGLSVKGAKRQPRTTNSRHGFRRYPNLVKGVVVVRPDQVWVGDITYVKLQREFVYLAVLMDVFTRAIRGWHLGRSLEGSLTLTALQMALGRSGAPEIHHSDQGVQYAASNYTDLLREARVQISMAEVGEPTENGYAERLMRTIKEEHVDLTEYLDYADAYRQMGRFLDEVYQHKRIHSSLGYLTPAEFESQWLKEQHESVVVQEESP
jgi:transposase InsO family protein